MVSMWSFPLLGGAGACYLIGCAVGLILGRWPLWANRFGYGLASLASLAVFLAGVLFLIDPQPQTGILFTTNFQWGLQMSIHLDAISAFFIVLLGLGGIAIGVYAGGYMRHFKQYSKRIPFLVAGFNLFWLAMLGVILANNIFGFLLCWEGMSLVSYLMVSFEHEKLEVRKSGFIYLITTHVGTAFLMGAFALLSANAGGSFSFDAIRAAQNIPAGSMIQSAIFICALIGFGTKAGIMPMHFWLPRAHPVAPGQVSASMSGIMLKMAIYGLLRVVSDLLLGGAAPPLWWGITIIVLGTASALLGALFALVETDLKRLLAFSSIENMGILFVCLGTAFIAQSLALPALTILAFCALLLHSLNHSIFKSLLFMGAGAIQHAAHTTNLEDMGGLIRYMPQTSVFMFIGCLASAGIPPFNGFASEWLMFQSVIGLIGHSQDLGGKIGATIILSALALTAAIATAAFLKVFGVAFLASPRKEKTAQATEAGRAMIRGIAIFAGLAAVLGIGSGAILWIISPVLKALTNAQSVALPVVWALPTGLSNTTLNVFSYVPVAILAPILIILLSWPLLRQYKPIRRVATWACGVKASSNTEYTALAFVKSLQQVFAGVIHEQQLIDTTYTLEPFVIKEQHYQQKREPFLSNSLMLRMKLEITKILDRVLFVQNGSVRLYLGYILLTLVALLIFSR